MSGDGGDARSDGDESSRGESDRGHERDAGGGLPRPDPADRPGRDRRRGADEESGPSIAPAVVVLVGGSAGLIGLQAGASPTEIGLLVAAGTATGGGLAWYLRRLGRQLPRDRTRR